MNIILSQKFGEWESPKSNNNENKMKINATGVTASGGMALMDIRDYVGELVNRTLRVAVVEVFFYIELKNIK